MRPTTSTSSAAPAAIGFHHRRKPRRKHSALQSGVFNLRLVLALLLCSGGASLAMLSFAVPAPSSGTNAAGAPLASTSVPQAQVGTASSVTVTEFSDFQCPYCKRAASVVEQVRQAYGKGVKVVFKQMPLRMHRYAFKAAQASVCARKQGKFWEYHDRLFASDNLSVDALNRIAEEVGLEQKLFNQCMASDTSRVEVEKDVAEADRLGVSGTPTFFVNGAPVEGATSFAALKEEIDGAMLGLHHTVARTAGQPADVWRFLSKDGIASNTLALLEQAARTQLPSESQRAVITSTTTAGGVTLSPSSLNFGYQLVGTTGAPMTETVTNSGTAPLVITDISVSGRDRGDFPPSYDFGLPVTIAPGGSITINFSFTPSLPWRAGTRNARLEISERHDSQYVPLTGIGATCLGPVPACSSGCPDTDGDGLNDAWEIAGGIDINNDGRVDPINDVLLPGADPNKPDIYVQYDWMDYGDQQTPCAVDTDCSLWGEGHAGETCSGPPVPGYEHSCAYSCIADSDCTSRQFSHVGERCIQNRCQHTHDPEILKPGAIQAVMDSFAAHGINLHVVRGSVVSHSHVVSFRLLASPNPLNVMSDICEGGSVSSGTAGLGNYAESFYDLKSRFFDPKQAVAYHYCIFGHYSSCDSDGHCANCPTPGAYNPDGSSKTDKPNFPQTGIAEESGNDFIVSMANPFNDVGVPPTIFNLGGTFMHELGHNLGLHHGGGSVVTDDVEDIPNYKPNYLSVMNYKYQLTGIHSADAIGSNVPDPALTRLDYSTQTLPTYTWYGLHVLRENGGLDETRGLASGTADLFTYNSGISTSCRPFIGASTGPIDWDGDGDATETNATADLNPRDHPSQACDGTTLEALVGHTDWGPAPGQSVFTYGFQCTSAGSEDGAVLPGNPPRRRTIIQHELTAEMAKRAHALYPTRPIHIEITPGHADKTIAPGRRGEFAVALLGSANLDVREIELSSLRFHGALPLRTEFSDINRDGHLDLVVFFDQASVHLHPQATKAHVTGWLKNSQLFIGEDRITIVP